jgi:rod shape-determining protein MreD
MQEIQLRLSDWIGLLPLCLLLYITQIPGFGYIRIDMLALLVAMFSVYRSQGLPLLLAFAIGLAQDVVSLAPIGQHAIGLVVLAYVAQSVRDRIRMQAVPNQLLAIYAGLLLVKFIHSWVVALGFGQLPTLNSFLSVLVTGLFWVPVVMVAMQLTRKRPSARTGIA